jgi:hypothetical protein
VLFARGNLHNRFRAGAEKCHPRSWRRCVSLLSCRPINWLCWKQSIQLCVSVTLGSGGVNRLYWSFYKSGGVRSWARSGQRPHPIMKSSKNSGTRQLLRPQCGQSCRAIPSSFGNRQMNYALRLCFLLCTLPLPYSAYSRVIPCALLNAVGALINDFGTVGEWTHVQLVNTPCSHVESLCPAVVRAA